MPLVLYGCSRGDKPSDLRSSATHEFGVYLKIGEDDRIQIETPNAEMGQGTFDALAKILADELDADWGKVDVILSGANAAMINPRLRGQITGNSDALRGYWPILREAGAAARLMLRQAAASRYDLALEACTTEAGFVKAGAKRVSYGALVADAAQLPVPETPPLKAAKDFTLIGTDRSRKETKSKTDGSAIFGIDVMLPDMVVAALAMPPQAWGVPVLLDDAGIGARDDIHSISPVTGGFAVIADDFWTAKSAAEEISVGVEPSDDPIQSTSDIEQRLQEALADGATDAALYAAVEEGDTLAASRDKINQALLSANQRISIDHKVPMLAHGALEPLCCTTIFTPSGMTIWAPHQSPGEVLALAAKRSGLPQDAITVNRTFLGGGFGRKWNTDFVQQSIEAAMAFPGRPVKLIWTREQDTQHDFYRPANHSKLEIGLDEAGHITTWENRIAGQSLSRTWYAWFTSEMTDDTLHKRPPYRFAQMHLETRGVDLPVPIGWWRSVAHAPTIFFTETAMEEAAALTAADPFEYRMAHLDDPRAIQVLNALRDMTDWPAYSGEGIGRGISLTHGYDSYCAMGVEVKLQDDGVGVQRIWAAVDCGLAVEPENVRRQIEGGILFGLGAALDGKVEFEAGAAQAYNLNDIGALSPFSVPPVSVQLVSAGGDQPGGVGELGTPGIAPALCNAIAAAGGPRIRDLPISSAGLTVAL